MNKPVSVMDPDEVEILLPVESDRNSCTDMMSVDGVYDVFATRKALIQKYYNKNPDLLSKISKSPDGSTARAVINAVIEEMARESDHLLGNELIFTQDGALHDATTVSVKRTEILNSLSSIAIKKVELDRMTNTVDLNSPVFQVFQQICVDNLRLVLKDLGYDNEMVQVVLVKWGEYMSTWDKDLKLRMVGTEDGKGKH